VADSLRARIAEALDGAFTSVTDFDAETAADAVLPVVQPELDRLRAENTALLDLVADFVDHDPCDLDHHGYCQAHMWIGSPLPCPHGRAKAMFNLDSEETGS
jgi:hypothetical protein